ncbi:MAG: MoxR family ATPase [Proteobacteria bacterium]|nr:MoxR family ATPase [Pseudomonadota bacterium]
MADDTASWYIYQDKAKPVDDKVLESWLADAPPWRTPGLPWQDRADKVDRGPPAFPDGGPLRRRAERYITTNGARELNAVNIALRLRRPLLVEGAPGIGKSSLAYSIAWRLGLGIPLRWDISSRTTLQDGLYEYDAVSHLQATRGSGRPSERPDSAEPQSDRPESHLSLGEFITLGPFGTALLPTRRPRVILIDELDKASYDLPNDLLHVFEEGSFVIKELVRLGGETWVLPCDHQGTQGGKKDRVKIIAGRVRTHHHPVVVITTNREREFPEAFRRRCVRLELQRPDDPTILAELVKNWLGHQNVDELLAAYAEENTDVLLQALFLEDQGAPRSAVQESLSRRTTRES